MTTTNQFIFRLQNNVPREWNLDVAELEYSPTARDLNDAKFHHLLSDEYKRVRQRVSLFFF